MTSSGEETSSCEDIDRSEPTSRRSSEDPAIGDEAKANRKVTKRAISGQSSKLPVSEVFRQTCYKCGNLGHHADECEHKERLCYNCKKPGHESCECPEDRNSEAKQCYYCKLIGHIQSQCPKYRQEQGQQRRNNSHPGYSRGLPSTPFQIPQTNNMMNHYYPQQPQQIPGYMGYNYITYYGPESSRFQQSYPQPYHSGVQRFSPFTPPPPQHSFQQLPGQHPHLPARPLNLQAPQQHFFVTPVHHYGNLLLRLRNFQSDVNLRGSYVASCYSCGEPGHESSNCPNT